MQKQLLKPITTPTKRGVEGQSQLGLFLNQFMIAE